MEGTCGLRPLIPGWDRWVVGAVSGIPGAGAGYPRSGSRLPAQLRPSGLLRGPLSQGSYIPFLYGQDLEKWIQLPQSSYGDSSPSGSRLAAQLRPDGLALQAAITGDALAGPPLNPVMTGRMRLPELGAFKGRAVQGVLVWGGTKYNSFL